MDRRTFLKSSLIAIGGLVVLPLVSLPKASPVQILRREQRVRYRDIDFRLDYNTNWLCEQLYGEAMIKGKRYCKVFLIDPAHIKQDKQLGYFMDKIANWTQAH